MTGITPEILSLIAEFDEFKGAWWAIDRIAPEGLSVASWRRVAALRRPSRTYPGRPRTDLAV